MCVYYTRLTIVVQGQRSAAQVLKAARKAARERGYELKQLPKRGKGSHTIWAVSDVDGTEVARLALTGHAGAMTPTVTRSVEQAGEPAFGKGWLDK